MDNAVTKLSGLSESIVRTLAYYDLFDHPMTSSEIFSNLPTNHVTQADIETELTLLKEGSHIFRFGNYYSLQNNPSLENRRISGNALAKKYMTIAMKKANLIARFPFVRSVMISGSLSKGYADSQSDIDFFIVTTPRRLWIARSLLVLYKRIFLLNSHKYFCINYFVDAEHLQIEEKNIFTATELTTLIPLYGAAYHTDLLFHNQWIHQFFPNYSTNLSKEPTQPDGMIKRCAEWILNLCLPGLFDRLFMRLTLLRWEKLYRRNYPAADFEIAFKTNRHISKNHPNYYQRKIVERYEERIRALGKHFAKKKLA